jgi:hypothetical protein
MTQPIPILLMIRGNKLAAMSAAHAHGIAVTILRSTIGETIARCDQRYRSDVERWWEETDARRDGSLVMF